MTKLSYTIVGVIGHIDHGKTSLVAALSGVDTDTNPEEKRRGITIDLGFASYEEKGEVFALIDAPGHQKYIGNLLAGVSWIDVGLLVVGCDQGIQAQTMEHTAILKSLGVRTLVIALSRADIATETQINEAIVGVQLLMEDLLVLDYEIVITSTKTGQGIADLRAALMRYRRDSHCQTVDAFRMPIDRVFSKEGRGTVVAGTPWTGHVQKGDELQVARTGEMLRVREIEIHGQNENASLAGYRTAMNLAGPDAQTLVRGDELITADTYRKTKRVLACISLFGNVASVRLPSQYLFYTGTTHGEARVLGPQLLETGGETPVILQLSQSIVFTHGQKFLLRLPYPVGSCASGRLLAPLDDIHQKSERLLSAAHDLKQADFAARLIGLIEIRGLVEMGDRTLGSQLGINSEEVGVAIQNAAKDTRVMAFKNSLISRELIESVKRLLVKCLTTQSVKHDAWMSEDALLHLGGKRGSKIAAVVAIIELEEMKTIVRENHMVAIRCDKTTLSRKQTVTLQTILDSLEKNRTPPTVTELVDITSQPKQMIVSLLRFAVQQKRIIRIDNGLYYSAEMFQVFRSELSSMFSPGVERTVAEIRDHLKITRKYAIPLLEYCDQEGLTVRTEANRRAGSAL